MVKISIPESFLENSPSCFNLINRNQPVNRIGKDIQKLKTCRSNLKVRSKNVEVGWNVEMKEEAIPVDLDNVGHLPQVPSSLGDDQFEYNLNPHRSQIPNHHCLPCLL